MEVEHGNQRKKRKIKPLASGSFGAKAYYRWSFKKTESAFREPTVVSGEKEIKSMQGQGKGGKETQGLCFNVNRIRRQMKGAGNPRAIICN